MCRLTRQVVVHNSWQLFFFSSENIPSIFSLSCSFHLCRPCSLTWRAQGTKEKHFQIQKDIVPAAMFNGCHRYPLRDDPPRNNRQLPLLYLFVSLTTCVCVDRYQYAVFPIFLGLPFEKGTLFFIIHSIFQPVVRLENDTPATERRWTWNKVEEKNDDKATFFCKFPFSFFSICVLKTMFCLCQ